jgi:hyperosmotically inducible periplasmic protein
MSVFSPSLRVAVVSCAFIVFAGAPVALQAQDQSATPASAAPDNSAQNKGQQTTADQQKSNTSDRDITKKIRQSIIADKSLSAYGHNVKIITQSGMVTLKGPVQSDSEKQTIDSLAVDVVGQDKVSNQLTVKQ